MVKKSFNKQSKLVDFLIIILFVFHGGVHWMSKVQIRLYIF